MKKCIAATWLFKADISNLNAGEGGTNLKELKTYNNGLPYASGQSVRHAIRKAIQREHPYSFKCTPEYPCGDVENCWLCDIFGYLQPKGTKRWSPLKVTPALGQLRKGITTDMILRLVHDIECPKCHKKINPFSGRQRDDNSEDEKDIKKNSKLTCPECKEEFNAPYDIRQALAYKQLTDNTYRMGISIDIEAIGLEETPKIVGEGDQAKIDGINYRCYLDEEKKKERVKSILKAIANLSDFASQSREMTNASPDAILISYQNEYNHRLSSALEMDEDGNINEQRFKDIINDVININESNLLAGFVAGTIKNQDAIIKVLMDKEVEITTPREAINTIKSIL